MGIALSVLLIEDSEADTALLVREFRRGGYAPVWERVDTAVALAGALKRQDWDLITCDYVLPQFNALDALQIIQAHGLDVPVIIVSGEVGEEAAVATMKAGAHDFVSKDRLARLVPAAERELREAEGRRARRRAEEALRRSEEQHRSLIETTTEWIWEIDREARLTYSNPAVEMILGRHPEELIGQSSLSFIHAEDREAVEQALEQCIADKHGWRSWVIRRQHQDGSYRFLESNALPVLDAQGEILGLRGSDHDITDRKLAERALRASEERFRTYIEQASDFILTLDPSGRVTSANRAVCEALGYSVEELIGRSPLEFVVPETRAATGVALGRVLGAETVDRFEVEALAKDGRRLTLEIRGRTILDAGRLVEVFQIARDITERRRAEEERAAMARAAAEASRAQQEAAVVAAALARVARELISSLDQPVLLDRLCRVTTEVLECDTSHTFLWDPSAQAYVVVSGCGDTREQWESIRVLRIPPALVRELLTRVDRDQVAHAVLGEAPEFFPAATVSQKYGVTVGLYVALRRGEELIGVQAAGYRGRTAPFSAVQLRIAEGIGQLASLALANARLLEEVERANRLKSDFVTTMSHELRTPLNAIMGYNDLLLDGAFGDVLPEQAEILQRVARSGQQLLELINATLDLSRLETGQVAVERAAVQLATLLREVADETVELQKPAVNVVWDIPPQLPTLYTDPVKLKLVVKNLVANAIKFTDQGSVAVRGTTRDGGVEIQVSDTGIGIAPDVLPIIFEPFRQADSSTTRRYAGVGLGLYIVRRLLDLIGGTVDVGSEVGRGSTFRVWVSNMP